MEENDDSEAWDGWPPEQQHIESARGWLDRQSTEKKQKLLERENFFRYVQWVAHEQWYAIKSYAGERGVALLGDIPFGINYCSSDVYLRRVDFALDWSGVEPPVLYFLDSALTPIWAQSQRI